MQGTNSQLSFFLFVSCMHLCDHDDNVSDKQANSRETIVSWLILNVESRVDFITCSLLNMNINSKNIKTTVTE